jgi:hypothetical protein
MLGEQFNCFELSGYTFSPTWSMMPVSADLNIWRLESASKRDALY